MNISSFIFKEDGLWFFWSETWSDAEGPYATKMQAIQEMERYCYYLDTGEVIRPAHMSVI